jgi:hypothetical protein
MDLGELGLGGGSGVDLVGSKYGPVAVTCEHGDEPLGSGAMELVIMGNVLFTIFVLFLLY